MSAIIAASDDEMQAEIERLRAENESLKQQLEDEKQARKTWENEAERRSDRYTNDVAALQQQLAQRVPDGWQLVRTDAERYRWLRDSDHWPAAFDSHIAPEPVRGGYLDAAIDAAKERT